MQSSLKDFEWPRFYATHAEVREFFLKLGKKDKSELKKDTRLDHFGY